MVAHLCIRSTFQMGPRKPPCGGPGAVLGGAPGKAQGGGTQVEKRAPPLISPLNSPLNSATKFDPHIQTKDSSPGLQDPPPNGAQLEAP